MSYPLPADILSLGIRPQDLSNFGLLFHRFVNQEVHAGGVEERKEYDTLISLFNQSNSAVRSHLQRILDAIQRRQHDVRQSLPAIGYHCSEPIVFEVAWRLTAGLGAPSAFNVGFTLHHLFGVPYVPGSSVKGILRHFAMLTAIAAPLGIHPIDVSMLSDMVAVRGWKAAHQSTALEWLERLLSALYDSPRMMPEVDQKAAKDELDGLKHELQNPHPQNQHLYTWPRGESLILQGDCTVQKIWDGLRDTPYRGCAQFCRIFGSTHRRGEALFFDVLPAVNPLPHLKLDIMNPHYREYYTDPTTAPPADYHEPKPVYFMSVNRGAQFHAFVAVRDRELLLPLIGHVDGENWTGWLPRALQEWGIGAKTHAGYGELRPKATIAAAVTRSSPPKLAPAEIDTEPSMVRAVRQLPPNRVPQEIYQHYQKLQSLTDPHQRQQLARAILDKIAEAKWRGARTKAWVKELQQLVAGTAP